MNMPTQGEIIRDLAVKLERQLIISELSECKDFEEVKAYLEKLKAKNE